MRLPPAPHARVRVLVIDDDARYLKSHQAGRTGGVKDAAAVPRPSKRITNPLRIAAVLETSGALCVETGDGKVIRFATARIDEGTLRLRSPSSPCGAASLVTLCLESKGVQLFGCARALSVTETELVLALPLALLQTRERGLAPQRAEIVCAASFTSSQLASFFRQEGRPAPVARGNSFLRFQDGELSGHVSGHRVFSRTWVTQHLLVKTGVARAVQSAQQLVSHCFEFGESLLDIEYVRCVWQGNERLFEEISKRFFSTGLAYRTRYQSMRLGLARPCGPTPLPVRQAGREDESAFLHFLGRSEAPVKLLSEDLVEGRFAMAGRSLLAVDGPRGQTLGWALCEPHSFRLFLLEPGGALAPEARRSLAAFATSSHCQAAPSDVADLEASGFVDEGCRYEFGAHRSVTREFTRQMGAILARARKHPAAARLVSQFY